MVVRALGGWLAGTWLGGCSLLEGTIGFATMVVVGLWCLART